ncbi:MAG: GHKL domain-containing protein [Subdoligranulum sp.]
MIRIAIVEDDTGYRSQLRKYIDQYQSDFSETVSVSEFSDGLEIVEKYKSEYDIILMDIQMKHMDGMQAAMRIRDMDKNVIIIFITNSAQFAVQGYKVEALDYVLKPIQYFAFSQVLHNAVKKVHGKSKFYIHLIQESKMIRLDADQILYIESRGHTIIYHTEIGEYAERGSLKSAEEKLAQRHYYKCNNCYLVNLASCGACESAGRNRKRAESANQPRTEEKLYGSPCCIYGRRITGVIQDIPKLYTALAEWLACVLFVRLLPQRYDAVKTAGILAAALPLFGLVQWLIGIVPLSLWIPGMIVALVLMYATIWLCCRLNFCDTGFWWALAFTLAEFVASLEWQLYSFGASKMPGSWWIQGLFLLAFYGGGFGVFLRLEQKRLRDKAPLHMTRRESISAAVIAICTFLISNISYVTTNTPFSGRMTTEIFWIRTLVDFAGVAVLLSMQDRWQDMQTQHELTAIQTLLKRQYEQYRISRDNSEAINRKYHDLKHQIQVIRMESDAARREEYLSQLEKGMQSLGVNQHTGNDVLDTILSDKQLYCSQHQITLTIVADGARLDFIETMDICSIFGNALDNAIEGVEKLADPQQRLIRVAVYTQNVFLIIRVENYCTAQLSVVDGEYRTTKHDKDMHGYGIKSIRYTAEKYGGSVSADCSDNWFHLSVLLPLPEKA